jgi:hypothetical protein
MSVVAIAAALAAGQHGAVSRAQLLRLGVTPKAIRCALETGELVRRGTAVYVVGGAPRTWRQDLLVAVLDAGPGACASHRAAAILLGLARRDAAEVAEISVPHRRSGRIDGAIVHRNLDLLPDEHIVEVDGIPCTGPLRTLVDLGAVEPWWEVRDALERAVQSQQATILGAEWLLARLSKQGRHGCGVIRKVLDLRALKSASPQPGLLEPRMAGVFIRYGLPEAAYQHDVFGDGSVVVDFAYVAMRIAIEVDGFETHGTPDAMTGDFERQHRLELAGWKVIRFTWHQVTRRPAYVAKVIRGVLDAAGAPLGL